jgi:hypothetical protein
MDGGIMPDVPVVTYTVQELLKKIDDNMTRLFEKLDTKADKHEVDKISLKLEAHDLDIRALKDESSRRASAKAARVNYRQWLIPTIISAFLVVITAFTIWHPFG